MVLQYSPGCERQWLTSQCRSLIAALNHLLPFPESCKQYKDVLRSHHPVREHLDQWTIYFLPQLSLKEEAVIPKRAKECGHRTVSHPSEIWLLPSGSVSCSSRRPALTVAGAASHDKRPDRYLCPPTDLAETRVMKTHSLLQS